MSINLDEKINLIHEFIYNNLNNCYEINKINIDKLALDDIRISNGKLQEDILNQIINLGKIQFNFEINNDLYFNVYTDGFPYLVKFSANTSEKSNNDSLISYLLSELVLRKKINVLLPVLNIDTKVSQVEKFLKVKTNNYFQKNNKKVFQLKIRENFNKHVQSKTYNLNWKVFLFLIIYTLIQIKNSYTEFSHNNLTLDNIFIEEKTGETIYENDGITYNLPESNFIPKITNFENSFISSKVSKDINQSVILEEITDEDEDYDENGVSAENEDNVKQPKSKKQDDIITLCKDILKLNNNLNLETKNFLNKVIKLDKMNYNKLLNDDFFDEFKNSSKNSKATNKIITKLKDSKDSVLGNQKHLFDSAYASKRSIKKEEETEKKNIYTSKRSIKKDQEEKRPIKETEKRPIKETEKRFIKKDQENNLTGGYDKVTNLPFKTEKNTPFLTNDEKSTYKKKSAENPPREPAVLLEQTIYDTSKTKPPPQQAPPAYIPVYNEVGSAVASIPAFNNLTGPNPAYSQYQKVYNISMSNPLSQFTTINRVFEDVLPGDPRSLSFNTIYERIQLKNYMRNIILDNVDGEEMCINGGKNSILSYIKLMEINPYTLKLNPFEDLAQNFLLFRAAYPIRYDSQKGNIEIAKDSVGLNIRLYNMTVGEIRAETINKEISKFDFDLWREIEYYRFVRDEILLKNISPNFSSMILYKIDSKSAIDWKQLSVGKSTINYSNSYKLNELHDLKELNKILQKSRSSPKGPVNMFWINNVSSDKNSFWLDIENAFKNNTDYNLKWIDPSKFEFSDFLSKNKINKYPTLLIEYNTRFIKYDGTQTLNDLFDYLNNSVLNTNKLDLTVSCGRTMILMTEGPNTNIIKWASPIYSGQGSQAPMISNGYRNADVWKSVIFQILYILSVLQENELYFRELSFEKNFYIKDLFYDQANVKYWIYTINDVEYYVPNYGYIVVFDSRYSDISSPENIDLTKREFKICSNKLFKNNNGSYNLHSSTFMNQMREIINQINFTNKLKGLGAHPLTEPQILKLIDNIFIGHPSQNIKDLFIINFKEYLHNRIGSLLMVSEKELVNSYVKPITKRGKLVVWRERFEQYKWVIYKEKDVTTNNKHIIILKDGNNYIETSVHQNTLLGYPSTEKVSLNGITDQHIIEKYYLQ